MYSHLYSAVITGVKAEIIKVEINISRGLPGFNIVGLAGKTVRESAKRVRSAVTNSGFEWPVKKITVNLAPGDIKKYGSHFDLAIAAVLLKCSGQISIENAEKMIFAGELNLNGEINQVKGLLPMLLKAERNSFKKAVIPPANKKEADLLNNMKYIFLKKLGQIRNINRTSGQMKSKTENIVNDDIANMGFEKNRLRRYPDLNDIRGQHNAKKALITAAAGRHNLLFVGPPGSGKTVLARALVKLLSPLTEKELLQTASIYSISDNLDKINIDKKLRPFVAPHHSITAAGLIGGGRIPKPGEISLAHNGVLFLDELPEFNSKVLADLREPLERKAIKIVRQQGSYVFPADFQFIAAMNPCPCGFAGVKNRSCTCSERDIVRYQQKLSGPLKDRIDLQVEVPPLKTDEILFKTTADNSESKQIENIKNAQKIQASRYKNINIKSNSELELKDIEKFCPQSSSAEKTLKSAVESLKLSMRGYIRLMRVARTAADLKGHSVIKNEDIMQAVDFRWYAEKSEMLL